MNNKVIALIIVLILLIIVGGVFVAINLNNNTKENTLNTANQNNSQVAKQEENTNNNENEQQNIITNTQEKGKVLVLYFSQSGNTEKVANFIHEEVGGDIIKLETTKAYPRDYNELVNYAQEEQRNNARPELKTKIDNIRTI